MSWELESYFSQNPNQRDILIAIPHTGRVSADVALHWVMLSHPASVAWLGSSGQPIDVARNIMCSKALQMGCTHLFFLDSDIIVKPETLQMLYGENMPIVSACYLNRGPPYEIVANINNRPVSHKILEEHRNQLYEVEQIGCGCVLIDTRVLHRLAQKMDRFRCIRPHGDNMKPLTYSYNEAKALNYSCKECKGLLLSNFFLHLLGKDDNILASEDFYFSDQVRALGLQIFIHTAAFVIHETAPWHLVEAGAMNPISSAGDVT